MVEVDAVGFCDIGDGENLEVLTAVIEVIDLSVGKLIALEDVIHNVGIVESLKRKDAGRINFDGSENAVEIGSE